MDRAGRAPLHYAALTNDAAEVTRLIAEGEAPDSSDSRDSPRFTLRPRNTPLPRRLRCSTSARWSIQPTPSVTHRCLSQSSARAAGRR